MNIQRLLEITIQNEASDLHLVVGYQPQLRVHGQLYPIPGSAVLNAQDLEDLIYPLLTPHQKHIFETNFELDFGLEFANVARFRVNLYRQRGNMAAALRLIPKEIRTIEQTGLPDSVYRLTELRQGLVIVAGPTGHGKSTTLAAIINHINQNRAEHILTIEDPIEYVYPQGKSLISQRELNADTKSWANALKYALREDPNVVLVGEMRDLETIASVMTIAETGHLVFTTLHTNSAAQTVDRIIDVFPEIQQPQIRTQLSEVIEAIISLRLIPTIVPGRVLAYEILYGVPALRSLIRDGKTHLIDNLIQTSAEYGMVSMDACLAKLVKEGKISTEVAHTYSLHPEVLNKLLGHVGS